ALTSSAHGVGRPRTPRRRRVARTSPAGSTAGSPGSSRQQSQGDLATLVGDARIVIPGESEVLEMVAAWALAPSDTPAARNAPEKDLVSDLQVWASAASSTTPAAV